MGNGHLKTIIAVGLVVMGALLIINTAWLASQHSLVAANLDGVSTVLLFIIGGLLLLGGVVTFGRSIHITRREPDD